MLHKFINDYLESNSTYDKFIERWEFKVGGDEMLEDILEFEQKAEEDETKMLDKKKYPVVDLLDTMIEQKPRHYRLPLTDEENEQLDNMKKRLDGYNEELKNIQDKIYKRQKGFIVYLG